MPNPLASNSHKDRQSSSGGIGRTYWSRKVWLIGSLLAIWAFVAFGMSILGAETLNQISIGGIPFGFWMAQQGSIFVFVLLILFYALASDRMDDRESRTSNAHE